MLQPRGSSVLKPVGCPYTSSLACAQPHLTCSAVIHTRLDLAAPRGARIGIARRRDRRAGMCWPAAFLWASRFVEAGCAIARRWRGRMRASQVRARATSCESHPARFWLGCVLVANRSHAVAPDCARPRPVAEAAVRRSAAVWALRPAPRGHTRDWSLMSHSCRLMHSHRWEPHETLPWALTIRLANVCYIMKRLNCEGPEAPSCAVSRRNSPLLKINILRIEVHAQWALGATCRKPSGKRCFNPCKVLFQC
eukprot:231191-Chlamydomonas_euryale.AAC.2